LTGTRAKREVCGALDRTRQYLMSYKTERSASADAATGTRLGRRQSCYFALTPQLARSFRHGVIPIAGCPVPGTSETERTVSDFSQDRGFVNDLSRVVHLLTEEKILS